MPGYNAELFNPPAPIAYVILRNLENTVEITNVPMLLDTGADVTLIPQIFVEGKLDTEVYDDRIFELEGFNKTTSQSRVVLLQMIFEGKVFRGDFLTINQNYGIIGRNVLNSLNILFDGKNLRWELL